VSPGAALLIFFGGLFAGVVNAMAGGGSLLTVPLLSLAGVEGLAANGTNRISVLVQTGTAARGYVRRRVEGWNEAVQVFPPTLAGGLVGSLAVSQLEDDTFERLFGFLMIPILVLALWPTSDRSAGDRWPRWVTIVVFFGVGLYAGAIQAGVGLLLLMVLARAGHDLVSANLIKSYVVIGVSIIACTIFIARGQVEWGPAIVLSAGSGIGGFVGANIAVEGGERVIKPVLVISVVALSGRMIGLY
jgi:hypothetical protein